MKKKQNNSSKTPLSIYFASPKFDKVRAFFHKVRYKQVRVTFDNGSEDKIIEKKRPLGVYIAIVAIVALFILCASFTRLDSTVRIRWDKIPEIVSQLFTPSKWSLKTKDAWWDYLFNVACKRIWETVEMVFIATVLGTLLAVPFYLLASNNVTKNKPVNIIVRVIINIIRTIPTFVLAIIGAIFYGYNNTAGIFAMTIFTFGIIFKLMYEYIETQDMNPFEVCISNGANRLEAYWNGLHPSVYPMFMSNFVYTFEINIRASVVLGFVGAGGIGQLLSDATSATQWDKVGAILVPLFIVVFVLQLVSNYLRRRVIQ